MKPSPFQPVFLLALLWASIFTLSGGTSNILNTDNSYFSYLQDGSVEEPVTIVRLKRAASPNGPAKPNSSGTLGTRKTSTTTEVPTTTTEVEAGDGRGWIDSNQFDKQLIEKVDIPERVLNETVATNLKNSTENLTQGMDDHKYYTSSFVAYDKTWVDLDKLNTTGDSKVEEHPMLSKSYRRAATIKLKFRFPFYGHPVENITIATGGFLYTGDYVHSWLAATQYIAPLMANFDTSQDEKAKIRYVDNGTALIVEWQHVHLQSRDEQMKPITEGPFTFQAVLHASGDIIFAYKEVPIKISNITHEEHPVKVGLSDAYIIDRTIFFVRRKTIYEYHRVNMKDEEITNSTAIYLKALATCNQLNSCNTCLVALDEDGKNLGCKWCPLINICSDGMDRNRQKWLMKSCEDSKKHLTPDQISKCDDMTNSNLDERYNSEQRDNGSDSDDVTSHEDDDVTQKKLTGKKGQYHSMGMAAVSIIITLIIVICGWFVYAYLFPHTWSGQLLIKYRPSRWHWRRGEPRYTAASIHM